MKQRRQPSPNRAAPGIDALAGTANDADSSSGRGLTAGPSQRTIRIMYWNVYHDFELKMRSKDFRSKLQGYDILFFAETDMREGEEDYIDVPRGFVLVSLPRKARLRRSRRGGGVALLIRETLVFKKSPLTSPEILVLDMGSLWIIGAYIPPASSRWEGWTDVAPFQRLWETAALCSQNENKHLLVLGDINGRPAALQSPSFTQSHPRLSMDLIVNARGRQIVQECGNAGLCILNGTALESVMAGRFTSFQPGGSSVIDFAIASRSLLPYVQDFHVELPTADPDDDWSDHTAISVGLDGSLFTHTAAVSAQKKTAPRDPPPDFSGTAPVDILYHETMDTRQSPSDALDSLWGPTLATSRATLVYVEGYIPPKSQTSRVPGAGIFFGSGSALNCALPVPSATQKMTADSARICAIIDCLRKTHSDTTLVIFCSSKQVIRKLCYEAANYSQLGWPGPDGSLYRIAVSLLSDRHAETRFVFVDVKDKNPQKQKAYLLAKSASCSPAPHPVFPMHQEKTEPLHSTM
uniref:Endonuclease/exonuclease/phosphatase domain-containing protein n=1 Tax=Mycena chlorophos TaxID=658473 RepID=A0ABQ0KTX5_MYCCL|nr:predicted protein [Mycena chlorophos]